MKNKTILIIGILILLVSMSFFVLIQEAQEVQAQEQEGCCLETVPVAGVSKQCVVTTRAECAGRFYTGPPFDCSNVPDCKPQTCIPKDKSEPCMRNKAAAECAAIGGVPDTRSLEEIPQCKPGCCIIAKGVKAEVLQYRQCENLTKALGYEPDMMEFKEGIVSEIECKKQGSPSDLGCCTLGGGDCKYGPRSECAEGSFVPLAGGLFCRDVASCALTSHSYADCGKLPGTETNIYWFDSQGNQEEIYDDPNTTKVEGNCNYPEAMCQKSEIGNVYCKSTRCENIYLEDQNMSSNPPRVDIRKRTVDLLTGTSVCYNFYTAYGDDKMKERSTGLQNQILHCSFGKIDVEGLGTDREKLCVEGGKPPALIHGTVKENKWENCSQCGASTALFGFGNEVGDFLGPAWIGIPSGKGWSAMFGDYCTKEKCEALGDCVYHEDMGALGGPGVLFGSTPVGSCDPIYPPGLDKSACADCGGGGDALWNLCTRAECYSKGDCQFKEASGWRRAGTFAWYWIGLATAERIGQIIPECIWTTIYCKGAIQTDPACLHPSNQNLFKCLLDRTKTYGVAAPIWLINGKLIGLAWNALSGEVTNTIISEGKKAIFGGGGGQTGGGTTGGQQQEQGGQGGGS